MFSSRCDIVACAHARTETIDHAVGERFSEPARVADSDEGVTFTVQDKHRRLDRGDHLCQFGCFVAVAREVPRVRLLAGKPRRRPG